MAIWSSVVDQSLTNQFLYPTDLSRVDNDVRLTFQTSTWPRSIYLISLAFFLDRSIDCPSTTPIHALENHTYPCLSLSDGMNTVLIVLLNKVQEVIKYCIVPGNRARSASQTESRPLGKVGLLCRFLQSAPIKHTTQAPLHLTSNHIHP